MKDDKAQLMAITAEWILPIASTSVRQGVLVLDGQEILEITSRETFAKKYRELAIEDFGQAAIVPGLINLHTHLDYTEQRYLDTDSSLFDWIPGLVAKSATWSAANWKRSASKGAAEVALSGTTLIADSSFSGQAAIAASEAGLRAVVGLELFGLAADQAEKQWTDWLQKYDDFKTGKDIQHALATRLLTLTVSPHAPYTVSPALWRRASDWAKSRDLPVLAHVAETAPEVEWIKCTNQIVDEFLGKVMKELSNETIQSFNWKGKGLSPAAHLEDYQLLNAHTVAAHSVHLSRQDMGILKKRDVGVAHCPRSNARLRSGVHPLPELLDCGINVGFGTDSAASVDNLDVRKEARFALNLHRALHPELKMSTADALYILTLGAARALKMDKSVGSLETGKLADIAVFQLDPENMRASPFDQLILGDPPLKHSFVGGSRIVKDGKLVSSQKVVCE